MQPLLELAAAWLGDAITHCTGLAAVTVPLDRGSGEREVTLDLPGYMQTNSYGCGAVSAAMAVRFLRPETSFGRVYDVIAPDPELGAGATRLIRGLRACGVKVAARSRLNFSALCQAIDDGAPVIVSIQNPGESCGHWVVVYGYCVRPAAVYVAGNSVPVLGDNRTPWRQFNAIREPKGNGLICSKTRPRPRVRSRATSHHK